MSKVCRRCGECCNKFELGLLQGDEATNRTIGQIVDKVSDAFRIHFGELTSVSLVVRGRCVAYDKVKGRCKVYKNRPERCRSFYCGRYENGDKKKKR